MLKHAILLASLAGSIISTAQAAEPNPLIDLLDSELKLSMDRLQSEDGTKPYYLQYTVTDEHRLGISATLGVLIRNQADHRRVLDVDVRCGDHALDSTHQIRGQASRVPQSLSTLPLDGDPEATRHAVWLHTDSSFKAHVQRLARVRANVKVKVEEEDTSDDFSKEAPNVTIEPWAPAPSADTSDHAALVKRISNRFRNQPVIYNSAVSLSALTTNQVMINSEGSRIQQGHSWWRISMQASTLAEDGMLLAQQSTFDSHEAGELADETTVARAADKLIEQVLALRNAPIVEPYTGPAILRNRASGVFFHEIFGHRIEGHRQKDVEEGQTFAKKLDADVLPEFLSVIDDPTKKRFGQVDLNGFYKFDQEGIAAAPTPLVRQGVLKTFLMSRSPARGITHSNGHGRRRPGLPVVARQGNLIVESSRQVPFEKLREMMLEECRQQKLEFGLLFEDISGGFTTTRRSGPQAFKVLPIIVYRVYVDGRPDELVRGVDIVGTPLTCFSKIVATSDDPAVFNGICGAESGDVPVSAISPSILVQQIEIEKRRKAQDRPPLLPAPNALGDMSKTEGQS
jgi:predicted Zn-dependent protease